MSAAAVTPPLLVRSQGAFCGEETVAPLAGQPRASSASGESHVHPHISDQDQLPQHQTDHSCVTRKGGG